MHKPLLTLTPRPHLLRLYGSRLMSEYFRGVSALCEGECFDTGFAEKVCPRLKRYRRRAAACARLLRRVAA